MATIEPTNLQTVARVSLSGSGDERIIVYKFTALSTSDDLRTESSCQAAWVVAVDGAQPTGSEAVTLRDDLDATGSSGTDGLTDTIRCASIVAGSVYHVASLHRGSVNSAVSNA